MTSLDILDPKAAARELGRLLLGHFFRAWAHEMNNPVQAVLAGAELIEMELGVAKGLDEACERVLPQAREMAKEALRVAEGIAQLHLLSRPLEHLEGSCEADTLLDAGLVLMAPMAAHAAVRMEASEEGIGPCSLALSLDAGRLVLVDALASVFEARSEGRSPLSLRWEVTQGGSRANLHIAYEGAPASWLAADLSGSLHTATEVSAHAEAGSLVLGFPCVSSD